MHNPEEGLSMENLQITCFMCNMVFCQNESTTPENTNIARVMCIGRIDPVIVLETLANGVDGIMLAGCKPPDCHFIDGNLQAERAAKMLKKLLNLSGLEPERVKLLWVSPIDPGNLEDYLKEFSEEIKKFGASPLKGEKPNPKLLLNLLAAKNAASDFRLRVLLGREKELTDLVNAYGEKIPQEDFDALLADVSQAEFVRHKIHLLTKAKPLSVKALAEQVDLKPADVLYHIVEMRRKNMIALDHIEGTTPIYKALEVA
jgi:F420-non-reducing hydrogenase iron-sulfur subunit